MELAQRALAVVVGLRPGVVVGLVDGPGGEQRVELGRDRRGIRAGGRRPEHDRETCREHGERAPEHAAMLATAEPPSRLLRYVGQ
jgi:hypothetical protein